MNIFYSKKTLDNNLVAPVFDSNIKLINKNNNSLFVDDKNNLLGFNIKCKNINIVEGRLFPTNEIIKYIEEQSGLSFKMSTKGFVVGQIINAEKIQDTHLTKCKVDIGSEILDIVCGANNARKDIKVVVATNGVLMPSGLLIKPTKLKGYDSIGMLCSQKELNLTGFNESGIIELPENYKVGEVLKQMYKNL